MVATRLLWMTLSAAVLLANQAGAQSSGLGCGDPFKTDGVGPFDYRSISTKMKTAVETHHFTPNVESLRSGNSRPIGGEIDYTLRAIPNHPRALMAMIRLGQREKSPQTRGALYSVACYVERAERFAPDDPNVRQIKGIYLAMEGRHAEAIADLSVVVERDPTNAGAHYNLGLAYFETKDYDRAAEHAKLARSLGVKLDGLDKKLKSVGKQID